MSGAVHNGSCLCEGISFTVCGVAEKVFACYCTDCSKNAGGPCQIMAKYPNTAVTILSGESLLKTWIIQRTTSGYEKHKVFCAQCGCTMWTIPMNHGGDKYIVRTSLLHEEAESWKPQAEFFVKDRPKYLEAIEGTSKFATMPGK